MNKIIDYTVPLFIVSHFILFLSIEKLILLWVGAEYMNSIFISQLLIICSLFGFIIQPANHYFMATLNYKYLYILAIVLPVSFLISIMLFIPSHGFEALAISKLITTLFAFTISLFGILGVIKISIIINKWLLPTLGVCLISFFLVSFFIEMFNPLNKEVYYLIALVAIIGLIILIGYFVLLITHKNNRRDISKIYKKIKRDIF
jgi:O-antigen/teichoic acid export membrane protein